MRPITYQSLTQSNDWQACMKFFGDCLPLRSTNGIKLYGSRALRQRKAARGLMLVNLTWVFLTEPSRLDVTNPLNEISWVGTQIDPVNLFYSLFPLYILTSRHVNLCTHQSGTSVPQIFEL